MVPDHRYDFVVIPDSILVYQLYWGFATESPARLFITFFVCHSLFMIE